MKIQKACKILFKNSQPFGKKFTKVSPLPTPAQAGVGKGDTCLPLWMPPPLENAKGLDSLQLPRFGLHKNNQNVTRHALRVQNVSKL